MITLDMRDPKMKENLEAIKELQSMGYSDEEIQKLYERQLQQDKKEESETLKENSSHLSR